MDSGILWEKTGLAKAHLEFRVWFHGFQTYIIGKERHLYDSITFGNNFKWYIDVSRGYLGQSQTWFFTG